MRWWRGRDLYSNLSRVELAEKKRLAIDRYPLQQKQYGRSIVAYAEGNHALEGDLLFPHDDSNAAASLSPRLSPYSHPQLVIAGLA